jgi:hypothetical protein
MKKLLVLLLIIGMASVANAALSIVGPTEINKDDMVTISVVSDSVTDQSAYLVFGYVSEGGFELSNPRSPIIPPPIPPIPTPPDDTIGFILIFSQDPNPYPPGIWFEVDLTCLKAGVDVFVELLHSDFTTVLDTLTIHQIPEPMTLALLGLGGLFLLRRRK